MAKKQSVKKSVSAKSKAAQTVKKAQSKPTFAKSAAPVKSAPAVAGVSVKIPTPGAVQKQPSKWTRLRSKVPPFFCESTTREDKLCLLSFCCGIILMASLFFADLFIRNYLESRRWEDQMLHTLQMKLDSYNNKATPPQTDGAAILNKQPAPRKELSTDSFQKKNKNARRTDF